MWKRRIYRYGGYNRNSKIRILDVGCGEGYFLKCIEKWFPNAEIYGLDIDDNKLYLASGRLNSAKLKKYDAHKLPFPDDSFDIVSAIQILEHLETPELLLREANRILRNGGILIIATPNPAGIAARVLRNRWHSYIPEHISLGTPKEWRVRVQRIGFKILEDGSTGITGFKFMRVFPFSLLNWIPMVVYGFFPWCRGESYMAFVKKKRRDDGK
jgi:ubiquinone/menaquinone biosynthesis C-methylase UbiE